MSGRNNNPDLVRRKFKRKARKLVRREVDLTKVALLGGHGNEYTCAITGFTYTTDAQMDHHGKSFAEILYQFSELFNFGPTDMLLRYDRQARKKVYVWPKQMRSEWRKYHRKHAKYRIVNGEAHSLHHKGLSREQIQIELL